MILSKVPRYQLSTACAEVQSKDYVEPYRVGKMTERYWFLLFIAKLICKVSPRFCQEDDFDYELQPPNRSYLVWPSKHDSDHRSVSHLNFKISPCSKAHLLPIWLDITRLSFVTLSFGINAMQFLFADQWKTLNITAETISIVIFSCVLQSSFFNKHTAYFSFSKLHVCLLICSLCQQTTILFSPMFSMAWISQTSFVVIVSTDFSIALFNRCCF